ncbi:DNA polymerase [Lapillicoccus jejuensis]|uniref:DNA-directed DNA polymerase n=1 Tax=Lapillicoccus jejuensis TaxID=402171 RepID=A0A542E6U3_9MICO|nr:DNA polymerase [Lapillicoccus jejuensis]TQJ11047.1 DNA polymerase-1 [Lapillicoccus jejuensis]
MLPLLVVGDRAVLGAGAGGGPPGGPVVGTVADVVDALAPLLEGDAPRLVVVDAASAAPVLAHRRFAGRQRVHRLWDVAEAHRLLAGGWAADPGLAWAHVAGLDPATRPRSASGDLFDFAADPGAEGDPGSPYGRGGHLRPDALTGSWATTPARLLAAADALARLALHQVEALGAVSSRAVATAHAESAAALLCVELERDGLPLDRPTALELIGLSAGPPPRDEADAAATRAQRDRDVLAHAPGWESTDLRNPAQVRTLLAAHGVSVPSTRAHVLEPFRRTHPLVEALLQWRKDERIATTYGYRWLAEHVGPDDRLRGAWTACDGAAGRMTAQNGLHNLPAPLRPAVAAADGHVLVRADLGQVEPRVLAAVSGDPAFAEATRADDLYAPVARKLGVPRPTAKIAVLAAMYGQRSGAAGEALRDLERAYPVAMRLLDDAYAAGVAGRPLRTVGGRLLPLDRLLRAADAREPASAGDDDPGGGEAPVGARDRSALDAGRGRFARNAVIQGAAAELFKAWAATVRHAVLPYDAAIVLCLHDELLVHAPEQHAARVAGLVERSLTDAARRWTGSDRVRFVAETSVVRRWSEAKD